MADDDPGWRRAVRGAPLTMLPGMVPRQVQKAPNGLLAIRMVFLSFVVSLLLIGVVVAILVPTLENEPTLGAGVGLAVVLADAVGVSLGVWWFGRRRLDCTTPSSLAAGYRTRFFLLVAMANSCALVAFAMFIVTHAWWLYAIGLAVSLSLLSRAAPTRQRLRAESATLRRFGCRTSLVEALSQPTQAMRPDPRPGVSDSWGPGDRRSSG